MANTPEMVQTALMVRPDMVTLVPERRQEVTTEGGLNVIANRQALAETIKRLADVGVPVSLFVDPDTAQIEASAEIGSPYIELHAGQYCEVFEETGSPEAELAVLFAAAAQAKLLGMGLNAGHGLHFGNVRPILALPNLIELNIGHSLIAEAIFMGLGPAVAKMKAILAGQ